MNASALNRRAAAVARDGTCRISGYIDAPESAHLVPLQEADWFSANYMQR